MAVYKPLWAKRKAAGLFRHLVCMSYIGQEIFVSLIKFCASSHVIVVDAFHTWDHEAEFFIITCRSRGETANKAEKATEL